MSATGRRIAMSPRNVVRVGAVTLPALAGVGATGGTAYAYWRTTGTGSGSAAATVAQALTTTTAAVSTGLLYPGATGDVQITINNPNPFPVTVTDIVNAVAITSDKGATCDSSTPVDFTDQSGLALAVPAAGSRTFTLTGKITMATSSDNSCQGATFTIPVQLTAHSS